MYLYITKRAIMFRVLFGFVFIPLFLGWLVYRALIKRDLRKHLTDLYGGIFFISAWLLIYYIMFFG